MYNACTLNFFEANQYIAVWLAGAGTLGAVCFSLFWALRNRHQLDDLLKALMIPTLIDLHERAAKRLERNSPIFVDRDEKNDYIIPCDTRALNNHLDLLKEEKEKAAENQQEIHVRNIELLITHIEVLIKCHEKLGKTTGIAATNPDE